MLPNGLGHPLLVAVWNYFLPWCSSHTYQSSWRDHIWQRRHCVCGHALWHSGHTPPVSNVFQVYPHVQLQRSSCRGCQRHWGHRMRSCPSPIFIAVCGVVVGVPSGECRWSNCRLPHKGRCNNDSSVPIIIPI